MKLVQFFGIDKFVNVWRLFREHGGVIRTLSDLYRTDDIRHGTLVGVDQMGNKYYENNAYFMPRNRWVDYNKRVWLDYDATQITPEWFRWLHHSTDIPPTLETDAAAPKWLLRHEENLSGSSRAYVPYSTTRTKVQAWRPPQHIAK